MSVVQERNVAVLGAGKTHRMFGGTPRQLVLLTVGLLALGVLLALVYALGLSSDSTSFTGLRARTDEVSATSDLYYELNDMDAQAANALLVGYHPADPSMVPASVDASASASVYEHNRRAADADLEQIARNPLLAGQAEKLLDDLGSYEALIAQALYIDQQAENEAPATPPSAALASYTQASSMLHATLLPISLQIGDADSSAVDASYAGERSDATLYGYAILALALLTAAALILANRYHARRFRRRLSLLALGALVSVVLGVTGLTTQVAAADHLNYAKQEAYDSIDALTRAKAVSDDANADESRWLLKRTSTLQTSFFDKISSVAGVAGVSGQSAGADPQPYYSGLSTAAYTLHLDAAANSVSGVTLSGYLGTELNNITFAGEAQAAYDTARAFNTYLQDDATIRSDAESGDLRSAVALDIGTRPGQSNYAFNQYMAKLGTVIGINGAAFTSGIATGLAGTDAATWATLIVGELMLLVCIVQACRLRLREYR